MLVPFSFMKTVPVVPVATAATGVGSTSFTANWNAFSGASYYLLDVSLSSSFSTFVLQNTVTTATSYVVTGLTSNTTYYYRVRAAINVDSDVAGFVSRVYTAGGSLSYTEVTATETLVADLKSYGIWTAMKAVYPMVGASAAACAQNLVSSSFTGTFTSGWTFASTGVTSNGTSAYFDTNYNPSNRTNPYLCMGLYSSYLKNYGGVKPLMSAQDNTRGSEYNFFYGNTNSFYAAYSYPLRATGTTNDTLAGFYLGSRTADNLVFMKQNSTNFSPNTSTLTWSVGSLPNTNVVVAGQNINGTLNQYTELNCSFCHISDGLTDTQASNFYTAVQTFNQTLNRQVGAQIVSDADAQAYINRVYTAGGTLTNTEANAVNQLVIDMKAAGIWTSMKAVYPMVGSSAAACAQNLKSSSFTGSFSSGWTFANTGITPNGTSAYMNTNFNPNTSLTSILSAHIGIYSRTQSRGGCDVSVNQGGAELTISADLNLIGIYGLSNIGSQYAGNTATQTSVGFFLANRQSATNNKIIQGTTTLATQTTSSGTTKPNANVFVGGQNNNGSLGLQTTRQQAFVSIGDGLTDTQASNFYTAVQTFQTTLSRQV